MGKEQPDDSIVVSPHQSIHKSWWVRNTGSTTWGSGYQLVFTSGKQMGAPSAVNVPDAAPNEVVELSVDITAPSEPGAHRGYWQLRNPQGTYFGPTLWVSVNTQSPSPSINTLTADPPSPSDANQVTIYAQAHDFPNLRAMRLKIDGEVVYELGASEFYYNWDTTSYAAGEHSIVIEATDWTDTSWAQPETKWVNYTLMGNTSPVNHAPYPPHPTDPADWHVYYSGNQAHLCAQANGDPDGDEITAYYFDVYDSADLWNSGWTGNNCVTTGALGPYGYQWRIKVRDSKGAESDWSDSRHFTLANPNLEITELYFEPQDGNSNAVKVRACTEGQGGVGITMRVSINRANDGSDSGEWHVIKELGVPCFNEIDAPIWYTLGYEDGPHLVRVEAHGSDSSWDGAAVREATYHLPHRRPASPQIIVPVPVSQDSRDPVYLNTNEVTFRWKPALRADDYTLHVSTKPNPQSDSDPLFRVPLPSSATEHTLPFAQDHPTLYWQVTSTNDKGKTASIDQLFGIDRVLPSCTIQTLPEVTYENVFQVARTATDDASGPQVADIQYLDSERGEWRDWLTQIPASKTFDLFTGQPGHTYRFRCRTTDQANNVGGYSSPSPAIIVDPTARPPEPWWNDNYSRKRNVIIQNNDQHTLPIHYPMHLHLDNTTTPTAADIYNASLTASKGNDVRIVYNNEIELDRFITTFSSSRIDIWFPLQATIGSGQTDNGTYQIYYGYAGAEVGPSNVNAVFLPQADTHTTAVWHFQEGSGNAVQDTSGNNHNGTFVNGGWVDGLLGFAGRFDGHSAYVEVGHSDSFRPGTITLEAWIYLPDYFPERNSGRIVDKERYQFRIHHDRKVQLVLSASGGDRTITGYTVLNIKQWYHVAATFDGNNEMRVYVNGVLDNQADFGAPPSEWSTAPLHIGNEAVVSNGFFPGYIQHLRISNVARTSFPYGRIVTPASVAVGIESTPPAAGTADLTLQSLTTFPRSEEGVLVQAVIANQGTQATQNGFYTDLYLDHRPTGPTSAGSIQFWVNDPIAAGDVVTLTTDIRSQDTFFTNHALPNKGLIDEVSGTLYAQVDSTGVVGEDNDDNNIYSPGIDMCVASSDSYEEDDTISSATALPFGSSQNHNFHALADQDWFTIQAVAGKEYRIKTSQLDFVADTYLYLYDADGETLFAANDDHDGTLASKIEWTAPASGTYYVLVKHWNPNASGCGTSYTITFTDQFERAYLPIVPYGDNH